MIVNNKIFFFSQLHKKFKNGMASNLFQVAKFSLVGDKDNYVFSNNEYVTNWNPQWKFNLAIMLYCKIIKISN